MSRPSIANRQSKIENPFAFTLVELLVVIGIIAVLIGILLPTLAKARDHAKTSVCMSNLRQIGQAFYAYVAENKGFGSISAYTLSIPVGSTGTLATRYWWGIHSTEFPSGPTTYDYTDGYMTRYFKTPSVLDCPTLYDESNGGLTGGTGFPRVGYAYNSSLPSNVVRFSTIRKPVETMALLDSAQFNITTNAFSSGELSQQPVLRFTPSRNLAPPSFHGRHRGQGNVLWYDGHVTTETPYITTNGNNLPSNIRAKVLQIARAKIGFLTPYGKSDIPEAELTTRTDGYVNYFYYANKQTKDNFK